MFVIKQCCEYALGICRRGINKNMHIKGTQYAHAFYVHKLLFENLFDLNF